MAIAARLQLNPLPVVASIDPGNLRHHIGGAMVAGAAGIYLTSPSLTGPLFPFAVALFWLSVAFLGASGPSRVLLSLFGVIIGSAWLSVAPAAYSGEGLAQTLWLAILTTVLVPLAWVRSIKPILQWLAPLWLLHAGVSLWQWLVADLHRVSGLSSNPNIGAGFLVLGIVYFLHRPGWERWLAVPLVAALPFTGSRWAAVVLAVLLTGAFGAKVVQWRYIAIGTVSALLLVGSVGWSDISAGYRLSWANPFSDAQNRLNGHDREGPARDLSFLPKGFWDSRIHNVPLRMMYETGILSGMAWIGATTYGLWKLPRNDYRWWLLLAVALLSMMDYYTWVGPLGWAWWLLLRSAPRTV